MRELRADELDMVSGAGLLTGLGKFLGGILGAGTLQAADGGNVTLVRDILGNAILSGNPIGVLLGGLLYPHPLGSSTLPPGLQGPLPAGHLPLGGHGPEIIFGPLPNGGALPGL